MCTAAEAKLLSLSCTDSRGKLLGGKNEHGVSFTDRCKNVQDNGVFLNPRCLSNIHACSEVNPCLQAQ